MREIKFRGKREDNGDWVFGWYSADYRYPRILTEYEDYIVIPETVGQYTGLKDKNGVEIYEGDIVHCISRFDDAKMVVIFEEGEFRMVLLEKIDSYVSGGGFYALRCFEKEVIGNIHDKAGDE